MWRRVQKFVVPNRREIASAELIGGVRFAAGRVSLAPCIELLQTF